ncbi:MAG: hypothetical protein JSR59_01560 [Proteobacteria bacterium]|nr:hypothetical protein [Pseudomonadota bacterium]
MNLWHVSEQGGIERFEPRLPPSPDSGLAEPVVWAIAESHLGNYLVPRDCPRVCLRAGPRTTPEDRQRFLGASAVESIVCIEADWLERVARAALWLYRLPDDSFRCVDAGAGYHVSATAVQSVEVHCVAAPIETMRRHRVELRCMEELTAYAARVAASTLTYSLIRMRNAQLKR